MPLNRFITFVKPYINLLAGAIVAWLIAKANVLGIPGLGEHGNELQIGIAAALAWGVTQLATEVGDLKWLKGHHLTIIGDAELQAARLQAPAALEPEHKALVSIAAEELPRDEEEFAAPPAVEPTLTQGPQEVMTIADDLPGDDEEFAAPPPDETNTPIQPSQVQAEGASA